MRIRNLNLSLMLLFGMVAGSAAAQESPAPQLCKAVHADLVEVRATVGCKPEHSFCFLGEVDGNHGSAHPRQGCGPRE